ncbi:MAG: quinolinate synthase NadA, partial [Phycisphaerales bacterium JB039]
HARAHPEKSVIVASAVHFMAEAVAILAHEHQQVWITNPKAGCTMEMMATDDMVLPCADQLLERYGDDLLVVAYMNTSGRIKALAGRTGGSACTSSNAPAVMRWALDQGRKVMFVPDEHLGRNTAVRIGLTPDQMAVLPDPREGPIEITDASVDGGLAALDRADVLLWRSFCGVHTIFTAEMVRWWRGQGWEVLIHPESPLEAVQEADGAGSTNFLWERIMNAPAGARIAVGTEGHFVRNAAEQAQLRGVEVRHLAEVPGFRQAGCGCATMSRNDPPHLAGTLDLLRRGEAPDINRVLPGDTVNSATMERDRLDPAERAEIAAEARRALDRMIEIVG